MSVKDSLTADMKTAMKAGDKESLGVIRMALAAIKQREIDSQSSLNDGEAIAVLDKMVKQRRESIDQFTAAGRNDLAERESREVDILQRYLPQPLPEGEIDALIERAVAASGAASMKDMGRVMAALKDQMQGRADMSAVSAKVKAKLSS
ncbi:MAG TPA: GatB/YqeY domain-containing protein [Gammaproteobacteria bacterium]|nr:GatB/YqeY domain-containing protein [Gammaproteobacteria bacterium]